MLPRLSTCCQDCQHAARKSNRLSCVIFIHRWGPDHRLTYASVKLTSIAVFWKLDLDYLCASRTAPNHSFRNPAERVMSILNLGLQSVGLARRQLDEESEKELKKCSTMAQMRELAVKKPSIKEALLDAVSPVKVTLAGITQRLELKGKQFIAGASATEADISELWSCLQQIDPEFVLCPTDKITHKKLPQKLQAFLKHCCRERHYFFDIKKCGDSVCTICKPPRLPSDMFAKVHHFPDPMPGEEGHYKSLKCLKQAQWKTTVLLLYKRSQQSDSFSILVCNMYATARLCCYVMSVECGG